MPRTSGVILLFHVSKNRQYVKSVFVELSTLFRRLHFLHVQYTIPISQHGAIRTLSLRSLADLEEVLPIPVIKSFGSSLKWFISSDFSKSLVNMFLFVCLHLIRPNSQTSRCFKDGKVRQDHVDVGISEVVVGICLEVPVREEQGWVNHQKRESEMERDDTCAMNLFKHYY